jgi:hypothetical protein
MAKKNDPTVTGALQGDPYPEGTHPARPVSEVTHSAENLEYRDMPADRKPDPSSIVQEQVLQGDEASAGGAVAADNA